MTDDNIFDMYRSMSFALQLKKLYMITYINHVIYDAAWSKTIITCLLQLLDTCASC